MSPQKKKAGQTASKTTKKRAPPKVGAVPSHDAADAVAMLRRLADKKTRDGMARYGLPNDKAFGVPMNKMLRLAKELGPNHALAAALWKTGWYEARMVAAMVDEPELVTAAQMDRWCRDFDNWGIVDTVCFKLFDRSPHALAKVEQWSDLDDEFRKRAAFALLACVALHDRNLPDDRFLRLLPLAERAASDERNFVKKGVVWALRGVGGRNLTLNAAVVALAKRLALSESASAKWIGRATLKELTTPALLRRLETRARE